MVWMSELLRELVVDVRITDQPWVVPPVMVAMRFGVLLLETGENQRSEIANCDAM